MPLKVRLVSAVACNSLGDCVMAGSSWPWDVLVDKVFGRVCRRLEAYLSY